MCIRDRSCVDYFALEAAASRGTPSSSSAKPKNRVEINVKVIYHLWVTRGNSWFVPSRIFGFFIAWLWVYWETVVYVVTVFHFPFSSYISMWRIVTNRLKANIWREVISSCQLENPRSEGLTLEDDHITVLFWRTLPKPGHVPWNGRAYLSVTQDCEAIAIRISTIACTLLL